MSGSVVILLLIAGLSEVLGTDAVAPSRAEATALVFVSTDCPIANASAPELNRIARSFADADVAMYRVYADPDLDDADIAEHTDAFNYIFPAIHDPDHLLVERCGATRVPEAAVFNREGELLYRGRIDNAFADFGKRRRVVTEHDLHDAIQAAIDGEEIANPRTDALGCYIPRLKNSEHPKEIVQDDTK